MLILKEKPLNHQENKGDVNKHIVEENINNVSNAFNAEENYKNMDKFSNLLLNLILLHTKFCDFIYFYSKTIFYIKVYYAMYRFYDGDNILSPFVALQF